MERGEKVLLTWEECMTAYSIGKTRQRRNEALNVPDQKISDRDPIDINTQGCGGEMAFAKMVDCYPNLSTTPQGGTADYINGDGQTIDIKTVFHQTPILMTLLKKAENLCDIYILFNGEIEYPVPTWTSYETKFELIGWAFGEDFLKKKNITGKLGKGPSYVLDGYFLNRDLREIINYPIRPAGR